MRFLVTDDLYTNRLRIKLILKELGHTCDEAVDGEDALKKISANNYDIILLDVEMPRMNGFETLQYIREKLPAHKRNIPVIIISSHRSLSFKHDYNAIIATPFTQERFENVLRKVINTIRDL